MDIVDDRTFKEYYHTVHAAHMKKIQNRTKTSYSGSEKRFQLDKLRLDYYAKFLTEYQYFEKIVKKKTFLETFKDTFIYLGDWERNYTANITEKSDQAIYFKERRNTFRDNMSAFVNNIIQICFVFNRNDDEVGVYHKYKSHKSQEYDLEALDVLNTFSKEYSLLLIDLITHDSHHGVSNVLRELLNRTKLLDRLQVVCAKEWYALSQEIQKRDIHPSPLLEIYFESKARKKRGSKHPTPITPQEYFSHVIDQEKLVAQSLELTQMVKAEELLSITEVIKVLLTELQEGDEIAVDDALTIIEENQPLEYLSQNELGEYFKQLLIDLPDFEFIRLKKSFRRKSSQQTGLLTNIDSIFIQSIPSSLHNIEESLLEIQQSQLDLLNQTQQLQELLESRFDLVIENQVKIEEYLFEKLGSEFEKIKHLWVMYKEKQLTGKEFVQKATKILGAKFSRIFVGMLFLLK